MDPALKRPGGADLARLAQLAAFLERARATVRYVDYRQAEADCELLAEKLLAALGADELASAHFVAVPRGGLVVLGILSYVLDLEPHQLRPAPGAGAPVVLVDDCALTGARLHRELRQLGDRTVTVALLYAHPELRRALEEREPGVSQCLAARDLEDRAPEIYPDPGELERWREEWAQRLDGDRYWLGLADLVCFSWSEPDRLFWNPVTGKVEQGWRFLPAERCLKNRADRGLPPKSGRPRLWRVDPSVVVGSFEGTLLLYLGATDEVFRLQGVAAEMWRALAAWGNRDDVIDHLRAEYAAERSRIAGDLESFVDSLLASGLLRAVRPG